MDIKNIVSKQVWEDRYRKNNETLKEQIDRVSSNIGKNEDEVKEFYNIMNEKLFMPAGRVISGTGLGKKLTLSNCFCLNFVPNNMEGIFEYVKKGALIHKSGGGTGYNFSLLSPKGTPTSNDAIASGVVSFMDVFDSQTKTVNAGSRRGANMSMLCIYHPDILEYIKSKSYEEDKLTQFNMSVLIDDNFMNAVINNKTIDLIYPCMSEDGGMLTKYDEGVKVYNTIDAIELWDIIIDRAYKYGEPGVIFYDNMNKTNNLAYLEKVVACNPCSEYISGVIKDHEDYFGACNLGSLFLHNFVVNPFEYDAYIDMELLSKTIYSAVKMLNNILDINYYPLNNFKKYQDNLRTIGLGITGLADMLCMLNKKYSDSSTVDFVDSLMEFITSTAYRASVELAKMDGSFPLYSNEFLNSGFLNSHDSSVWQDIKNDISKYGIRNGRIISIAPTGTLSLTFGENCSSGIEPIFSLEYDRKIKVGGQDDSNTTIFKMRDYAYEKWLHFNSDKNIVKKDVFETAMDLSVEAHVNMQIALAKHTDQAISKTINIPTNYSFSDTKELFIKGWKNGIKGLTIFRPNEIRQGILITDDNKEKDESNELSRGQWEERPNEIIGIDRKMYSGCGKVKLHIKIIPSEKRIFDFYITNSSNGGCRLNLEALTISMSAILRLGGNLKNIKQAYRGCGVCPSFVSARKSGKQVSKGSSCPTAIFNILEDVENDLKNDRLKELIAINYYNTKHNPVSVESDKEDTFTKDESSYLKENGEVAFVKKYHKCPICGDKELYTGDGCITCVKGCGWSKCS